MFKDLKEATKGLSVVARRAWSSGDRGHFLKEFLKTVREIERMLEQAGDDADKDLWKKFNEDLEGGVVSEVKVFELYRMLCDVVSRICKMRDDTGSTSVAFLIFSALDEELKQLEADSAFSFEEKPVRIPGGFKLRFGHHRASGKRIALASVGSMGMVSASYYMGRLLEMVEARIAIIVGICGGLPGKVNYGDIVVAERVLLYQFGAFENRITKRDAKLENLNPVVVKYIQEFASLKKVDSIRTEAEEKGICCADTALRMHFGPMGTADLVVKDSSLLAEPLQFERKLKAVDMEAYPFLYACNVRNTMAAVIKSASDLLDNKDDKYRQYAIYTSSIASRQFCEYLIEAYPKQFDRC